MKIRRSILTFALATAIALLAMGSLFPAADAPKEFWSC
jgi:uncharacterized membrane protein